MSMSNAAVTRIILETSATSHHVWTAGGTYLGPIGLKHGDAFDVIPRAIRRAEVYGWPNVSRDVELRRFPRR